MEYRISDSASVPYPGLINAITWLLQHDRHLLVDTLPHDPLASAAFEDLHTGHRHRTAATHISTLQRNLPYIHKLRTRGNLDRIVFKFGSRNLVYENNEVHWQPNLNAHSTMPNWLRVAYGELGVREIRGSEHSARVLEYHASTRQHLRTDDNDSPWCSSFVNWCISQAGLTGTNSAGSQSWLRWGTRIATPVYGCIGIISHGDGHGHVGFIVGRSRHRLIMLGGNQNNAVRLSPKNESEIARFVIPSTYTASAFNQVLTSMRATGSEITFAGSR